jgi:hypothetical protein
MASNLLELQWILGCRYYDFFPSVGSPYGEICYVCTCLNPRYLRALGSVHRERLFRRLSVDASALIESIMTLYGYNNGLTVKRGEEISFCTVIS